MNMIGHDDEFVEQESTCIAIVREGRDQEVGRGFPAEDGSSLGGDGGDEKDAVGVHFAMVVGMSEHCL